LKFTGDKYLASSRELQKSKKRENIKMNDKLHIPAGHVYDDRHHGRLLKLFTISCISSGILILSLVGFSIYTIFTNFILNEAKTDAESLGRALLEQEMETLIRSDLEAGKSVAVDEDEFRFFDQRVRRNLGVFQVPKIKIYSKDKKIVYSSDNTIIGKIDRRNENLDKALRGETISLFQSGGEGWDLDDEQRFDPDMVETYLPIRDSHNAIKGAFEIYMDMSPYRVGLKKVLTTSLAALIVILAFIFGTLLYFMRRSTQTIYSKTQELRVLSGLLPICSFCKKIRNNEGDWESLEKFITARSESAFSHSVCPACKEKHYPE
jgi:hypothetical protein